MSKPLTRLVRAITIGVLVIAVGISVCVFDEGTLLRVSLARTTQSRELGSLDKATGWINTEPLDSEALNGKVVLIDFWTYTCINWLRTLPHRQAWADKYRDQGLVVIGVHSPEFEFEKDSDNVRRASRALGVSYPVAIDSDHSIWRAFSNNYWPALYLIDAQGKIRHHQYGEGGFERTEQMIQKLLAEAGHESRGGLVSPAASGVVAAADWSNLASGENYLGYLRTENFSGTVRPDSSHVYRSGAPLRTNHWALVGNWKMTATAAELKAANGKLRYRFHGRDLHLVLKPATRGASIRFRVLLDGVPPGPAHGIDVDEQGYGTVTEPRLYQLIRQPPPIDDRDFEIEFLDAGVEAFAVTFG